MVAAPGVGGAEDWDEKIFFALSHFRTPSTFVGSFKELKLLVPLVVCEVDEPRLK